MICTECDKKIKKATLGLCKGCHAATYCLKCGVIGKAISSLCLGCYGAWETAKDLAWNTLLSR